MSETLRLFFALPLPEAALAPLVEAQARAKPLAARLSPRWTTLEQMHVTLKFLGELPAEALPGLAQIVEARARAAAPFEATLSHVVAFGGRRARVLAVELETASPVLGALVAGLEDDAASLGCARETRPFRAHVTLARFKHPGDARAVVEAARITPAPVALRELCLYQSQLTPTGARYAVVCARSLG